jgi:hypothetical protein
LTAVRARSKPIPTWPSAAPSSAKPRHSSRIERFGLLQLEQQHPFADRMQLSGRHPHHVARVHVHAVQQRQHLVGLLTRHHPCQAVGVDVVAQPEVHRRREDVPGLGLAVRAAEMSGREGIVGVGVHREALAGIEELHEQTRIGAPPLRVRTAQPVHGVGRDGVAQQDAGTARPSGSTVRPVRASPATVVVEAIQSSGSRPAGGGSARNAQMRAPPR